MRYDATRGSSEAKDDGAVRLTNADDSRGPSEIAIRKLIRAVKEKFFSIEAAYTVPCAGELDPDDKFDHAT